MRSRVSRILGTVYLACIVSCVLLSACLVANVCARYISEASGSAGARVVKWDVKMESSSTSMDFNGSEYAGDTESAAYDFKVISNSEVAMEYSVVITFAAPPPAQVRLSLDGESWQNCDGQETVFTFGKFSYAAGDGAKSHRLILEVEYMQGDIPNTFNFDHVSVTVTVTAEQVN